MKRCPKCQANVEGLIHHCDCCGASLDTRRYLFRCGLYDTPSCLLFGELAFTMMKEIEPDEPTKYGEFLEYISFMLICYPKWMLADGNIKNRVHYLSTKKQVNVTVVIDYQEYISASKEKKAHLVADAILRGMHMLQDRLKKYKLNINDLVNNADTVLNKYIVAND